MRILIIGAGKVGSSVAGNLVSESNDITIVDTNKAKIAEIQSNYDLQGIVGDATSPSVLADAGAVDADMIIAVTANDETNLAVTLIAEQLFNVPSRIARVRNDELREYPALLSTSGFRATSVIWPEEAITNYIVQLITYPEALQVIEFSDGDVVLMSVKIVSSSKMCGRPVSALQDELPRVKVQIVSIYRQKYRLDDIDGKTVRRRNFLPYNESLCACRREDLPSKDASLRPSHDRGRRQSGTAARKSSGSGRNGFGRRL